MNSLYKKYQSDFGKNLVLALPIIAGQVGQIMVNIADNVMVGKLGATSLAAISLSNSVFISLLVIGMGISFALPPLLAKAEGAGMKQMISLHLKHSFLVNMLFAVFAYVVIESIIPTMKFWGQDEEVLRLAIPYLRINAVSLFLFMAFQTFRTYSDGRSETVPPMIAMLFGNVVNIFFNYVLIYGQFGFPKLGVSGAAMGTFIARLFMLLVIVIMLRNWKNLWQDILDMRLVNYSKKEFRTILKLGIPTSLQGFFEVSAFGAAAVMAGQIGTEAQAAHQISINLASISFLICTGIAMAATIRVGNQFGQHNIQKLRDVGFASMLQVILFMSFTSVIYILLRRFFPALYVSNQEVIDIAASLLIVASIFQIPDGVQVTAIGALRGMQDVNVPTIITFIAYWLFALPLSYVLAFPFQMGAIGIWIGLTIGLSLSAIFMTLRFDNLSNRLKRQVDELNLD